MKFTQKVINCSNFNHYSERLIKQQADRLAEDGYKDVGYEYVSIDVSVAILYYELSKGGQWGMMQELQAGDYWDRNSKGHVISGMCLNHTTQIKKKSQRVLEAIDQSWVWEIFECQQSWFSVYQGGLIYAITAIIVSNKYLNK